MGINIVTDNCCDLPAEIIKRYGIRITHLRVRFGNKVYLPGEITNRQFYDKIKESDILPQTSQPPVEEILQVYSDALANQSTVIAIHMSSGISGTYQGGRVAQKILDNPRLHLFDSLKASVGQGLMVVEAARLVEQGESLENIIARLKDMQARMQCVFAVGNLECLIKGGRISKTKGLLINALDIKPILYFDEEGKIRPYDRARGYTGAMRKLLNIMGEQDLGTQTIGIVHAAVPDIATKLKHAIEERFGAREIIIGEVGPVIGSHVGAGTFSVFFEK